MKEKEKKIPSCENLFSRCHWLASYLKTRFLAYRVWVKKEEEEKYKNS